MLRVKRNYWFKDDEYFTNVYNFLQSDWRDGKKYRGRELICKEYRTEFVLAVLKFLYDLSMLKSFKNFDIYLPKVSVNNYGKFCNVFLSYNIDNTECSILISSNDNRNNSYKFTIYSASSEDFLIPSQSEIEVDDYSDRFRYFSRKFIDIFLNMVDDYLYNNFLNKGYVYESEV